MNLINPEGLRGSIIPDTLVQVSVNGVVVNKATVVADNEYYKQYIDAIRNPGVQVVEVTSLPSNPRVGMIYSNDEFLQGIDGERFYSKFYNKEENIVNFAYIVDGKVAALRDLYTPKFDELINTMRSNPTFDVSPLTQSSPIDWDFHEKNLGFDLKPMLPE